MFSNNIGYDNADNVSGLALGKRLGAFLLLGFFALWCGAICGEKLNLRAPKKRLLAAQRYARVYWVAFSLGCLGISLRLFDWFILRGLRFSVSAFENREKPLS